MTKSKWVHYGLLALTIGLWGVGLAVQHAAELGIPATIVALLVDAEAIGLKLLPPKGPTATLLLLVGLGMALSSCTPCTDQSSPKYGTAQCLIYRGSIDCAEKAAGDALQKAEGDFTQWQNGTALNVVAGQIASQGVGVAVEAVGCEFVDFEQLLQGQKLTTDGVPAVAVVDDYFTRWRQSQKLLKTQFKAVSR